MRDNILKEFIISQLYSQELEKPCFFPLDPSEWVEPLPCTLTVAMCLQDILLAKTNKFRGPLPLTVRQQQSAPDSVKTTDPQIPQVKGLP